MPFILLRLLVLLVVAAAPTARAADNFFEGKTVNLYVGGGAGGGYDQYARLIARHMGKHITGNPTFVVQNMPGAGGLQAANYLYEVARKDGTALAVLTREAGLVPLLQPNASAIKFKAAEFNWIGTPAQDTGLLLVNRKSPAQSIDDLRRHEVTVSGTGPGGGTSFFPRVLNTVFGMKFRVIEGYKGSPEALLALAKGEVDGHVSGGSSASFRNTVDPLIAAGELKVLLQLGFEKDDAYPQAPLAFDLVADEEQRKLLTLALTPLMLGRPVVGPPGVPGERVAQLREAFDATMKDPEFLAEANKQKMQISPLKGAEISKLIADVYALPSDLVGKVQAIMN
jgi:tripartite-type tricarboxylate transporter receptor subunit TctC